MLKRVLVTTDLSEASSKVMEQMNFLSCLGAREAVLMHCVNVRDVGGLTEQLKTELQKALDEQKTVLERLGLQVETELVAGLPHREIHRIADEKDCSLIVVGSHGRNVFVSAALLGGVAFDVVQSATKPVLVVRLKIVLEDECKSCKVACEDMTHHILYVTDFSKTAERAFAYLERLVESGAKRITLGHVQDKLKVKELLDYFNRIDQGRLEALRDRLTAKGAEEVDIHVHYGYPAEEIVRCARECDVSLIIMGSQGRGFTREVFLGSVSKEVVRSAPVPVLLIPAER